MPIAISPKAQPTEDPTKPAARAGLSAGGGSVYAPRTEPSAFEKLGGGLVVGLRKNFIMRPIVESIAEAIPGTTPDDIDKIEDRLAGSTLASVSQMVGEFAPDLALGVGAYSLGRVAATRTLGAVGRSSLAGHVPGSATVAKRLAGTAGETIATTKPLVERAGEIVGGSVALGALEGGLEYAEHRDIDQATRAFLVTTALGVGLEGGLVGVGAGLRKAGLFRASGSLNPEQQAGINKLFAEGGEKVFQKEIAGLDKKIKAWNGQIERINHTTRQVQALRQAGPVSRGQITAANRMVSNSAPERIKELGMNIKQAETAKSGFETLLQASPNPQIYTRSVPYNPVGVRLAYQQVAQKLVKTPDAFKGEFGPTFAKTFVELDKAETLTALAEKGYQAVITNHMFTAQKALGLSKKEVKKNRQAFLPLSNAWEEGGEAGVTQYMTRLKRSQTDIDDMLVVMRDMDEQMLVKGKQLAERGGQPLLTDRQLADFGLAKYMPHGLDDLPEDTIRQSLVREFGESRAAELWSVFKKEGIEGFGSTDFARLRSGTLGNKVDAGLAYDPNPFNQVFKYLSRADRRLNYGRVVGMHGENRPALIEAIAREGGSVDLADNIFDIALGNEYHSQAMRQFARVVTGTQIGRKLTLAVIPNFAQTTNTVLMNGIRNTARGFYRAARKEDDLHVMQSLGLIESAIQSTHRAFGESQLGPAFSGSVLAKAANAADTLAHYTLTGTGFNGVERWNRMISGHTGLYTFRSTLGKALDGRLRGNNLDIARRQFNSFGMNLDDIVRDGKLGRDAFFESAEYVDLERLAMFNAARTTQFTPSALRKPGWWSTPMGRITMQFKSFALGQGRFVRDQVFAEAVHGNVKPLAYFLSFYPIAGEVVGDVRSLAKLKPRDDNGLERIVRDYANVGGLGIVSDTFTAAKYGRLGDSLFGPTLGGDVMGFAERMAQGDIDGYAAQLAREPWFTTARNLTGLGVVTTEALLEHAGVLGEGGSSDLTPAAPSFFDMLSKPKKDLQ